MLFATPLYFLGAVLLLGHLTAYFLRSRHPPRYVSSLFLWQTSTRTASQGRRFRLPYLPPRFYLELLALLALLFAAVSPILPRTAHPVPTVVIDTSRSMQATSTRGLSTHQRVLHALPKAVLRAPKIRLIAADTPTPQLVGLLSPAELKAYLRNPDHFNADSDSLAGALALAHRLRTPNAPIFAFSDHAFPASSLPPQTTFQALGAPVANAAFHFVHRTQTQSGEDSLLVSIKSYPDSVPLPTPSISSARGSSVSSHQLNPILQNGADPTTPGLYRVILPHGTGPITLSLPPDALDADNSLTLLPAHTPKIPVALHFLNPALSNLTARAVHATQLVDLSPSTVHPPILFTDALILPTNTTAFSAVFQLRHAPDSAPLSAAPPMAEPNSPILEGLDFSGLTWPIRKGPPLPGIALLSCGTAPVFTFSPSPIPTYRLQVPPNATLFRSPVWPSLIWNILHFHAAAFAQTPPQIHHGTAESDLSRCSQASYTSPATTVSPDSAPATHQASTLPTSLLAATAGLLLLWLFILTRRAARAHSRRVVLRSSICFIGAFIALLLACCRPSIPRPHRAGTVIALVDRSSSIAPQEQNAQPTLVQSIAAQRAPGEAFGVVSFGASSAIEHAPSDAPFTGFTAALDAEGSDLQSAIHLAESLVPPDTPARFVVLSDGLTSPAKPTSRFPVDFRHQPSPSLSSPAFLRLNTPLTCLPGEGLLASAWLYSPTPISLDYRFRHGTNLVAGGTTEIPQGISSLYFRDAPHPDQSTSAYTLSISPAGSNHWQMARFFVSRPATRPLLVIPPSEQAPALGGLLQDAKIPHHVLRNPTSFDFSPASLNNYSGVLIENRPANDFGPVALSNLAVWVTEAGGSLALTGGRNAFGLGGYFKSPLEPILPVSLEIRNETRKFSMALAVALDRSGSMAAPTDGGYTKMDLANIGTTALLDLLTEADELAVFAVDSKAHTVLPLSSVKKAQKARNKIRSIQSEGGGIFVYEALVAAIQALQHSHAAVRHVVLFADAADAEEPGEYQKLIHLAESAGITISTIGLGSPSDCDAPLLREIASRGKGSCFFSESPHELPRLFTQDAIQVSKSALVEALTSLVFTPALPTFSDTLAHTELPPIGGYNLCYAHPDATVIARASDENQAPILITRSVGSGRTLAFTGEVAGELSGPFVTSPQATEFYAAFARFLSGDAWNLPPELSLRTALSQNALVIDLYLDDPLSLSQSPSVRLLRTSPMGSTSELLPLTWNAVDHLSVRIPLRASESVLPMLLLPNHPNPIRLAPVRLPFSPEILPDFNHQGLSTLQTLAKTTGGHQLLNPSEVWKALPESSIPFPLAPSLFLLSAALLLAQILDSKLTPNTPLSTPSQTISKTPSSTPVPKPPSKPHDFQSPEPPPPTPTPPKPTTPSLLKQAKAKARHRH